MNNKKLWYPAAMVIALSVAASAAQAKSLEQVGAAEGRGEPLKTYGVDVSTKSGLKTLLPTGWDLFIYKNTKLPQSISWTVGDTWVGALEKFADSNGLAVRLDWAKKAVYVSTPEVALETRAKLAEISNASRTPLPAYSVSTAPAKQPAAAAPVVLPPSKPLVAASAPAPTPAPAVAAPLPTYRPVTPTPAPTPVLSPEASRASADLLARALAATAPVGPGAVPPVLATPAAPVAAVGPALVAGAAQAVATSAVRPVAAPQAAEPVTASDAFVRGNMEEIVRKTAAKLGYQVSWETVSLPLTGPVTFLGVDAAEDMRLLQKSLGLRQSPIAIEVYRGSQLIRVTASAQSREPLAVYDSTYSGLIGYGPKTSAPSHLAQVAPPAAQPTVAPEARTLPTPTVATTRAPAPVAQVPVVVVKPAPTLLTLQIAKGDSLKKAISQFLKAEGWELDWRVGDDLESQYPFTATGASVALTLRELLPKLGLDTDVYGPSKMVIVRPIDNTAE